MSERIEKLATDISEAIARGPFFAGEHSGFSANCQTAIRELLIEYAKEIQRMSIEP